MLGQKVCSTEVFTDGHKLIIMWGDMIFLSFMLCLHVIKTSNVSQEFMLIWKLIKNILYASKTFMTYERFLEVHYIVSTTSLFISQRKTILENKKLEL